jgi:protein-S-isoprenylcysteine O-methyltransferase Ste14
VISGGVLLVYSTRLFAKHGRGGSPLPFDPPKKLVTVGIYKYIRNPMFTASALIWIGEFLFFGSILLFVYALGWIVFNHIHLIIQDEKWLERRYGKEYIDYKKSTPRYLPKLF